jgi:hypothetical protein
LVVRGVGGKRRGGEDGRTRRWKGGKDEEEDVKIMIDRYGLR